MKERHIPDRLARDFVQEAAKINGLMMTGVSFFAVGVELFNMVRVLALSGAGLGTLNNRIYFGFYLVLFLAGLGYLILESLLKMGEQAKYKLSLVSGSVFLLWHTFFNMYDMYRSVSAGKIMAITTLVAFSALYMMRPLYAAVNLALNFALLIPWIYLVSGRDPGVLINYSIAAALCLVIYIVRFRNICLELGQKEQISDITRQLEESRKQFSLSREQYALILQKGHFITFEWNLESGEVRFSGEWERVFGKEGLIPDVEEFIRMGRRLKPPYKAEILGCMENLKKGELYQKRDLLLPVAGGEERWYELHLIRQSGGEDGAAVGIGMLFDIMDQKQRIMELEKELQMDNFTRLLNKTAMESYAGRRLGELRERERLYMLILDMDHFKRINDSFGHPCGDHVLEKVAELMNASAPEGARVGRLGGDEFGVALVTRNGGQSFMEYARKLVEEIRQIRWNGEDVGAGCSIGVASAGRKEASWEQLYHNADRALYAAKRAGRNCVYEYDGTTE